MATPLHDWDRPLDEREVEALSPAAKGLRSRTSLERKVTVLEDWAKNPILANINKAAIPWKRPGLRTWQDTDLKLWPWKFADVDLPTGKNKELMVRYEKAISDIRKLFSAPETDQEILALELRVKALEEQNLNLLNQILRLQKYARQPRTGRK
jgi:hypothetical protein